MKNTCGGCTATWTDKHAAHCANCHQTFGGVAMFDRHRSQAGEHGSCRPPAELTGARLVDGVWRGPERDPALFARLTARR